MKTTSKGESPGGSWKWITAVGLAAFLIGIMDPLRVSIMANHPEFEANLGSVADWDPTKAARDEQNRLQEAEIMRTQEFVGAESIAFDPQGRGPYTGVADGRVMLWSGTGWTEFAYTSPNWSRACIPMDPTTPNIKLEHICGRPLGLRFNKSSGDLYIADAYFGLMIVGPRGGLARSLSSEADGLPFTFTNDLDLDSDGFVYFTDTSSKYPRSKFVLTALAWDNSGRLLRYDTATNETEVLLRGLVAPNGVSVSKDGSFLVVAEGISASLLRYWLKGPKAGTVELFAQSPGHPDNVRMNSKGEFWVAMHCKRNLFMKLLSPQPWIRSTLARLPISMPYIYSMMLAARPHAMVARYSEEGELLEVLEDAEGKVVKLVSEAEERDDGKLWIGSAIMPQIAVLSLPARAQAP